MSIPPDVLDELAAHAAAADADPHWPAASWQALRSGGVLTWSIPSECGGVGLDRHALLDGYAQLAGVCLTSSFILSQREAAVRRILDSGNETLMRGLLPSLASGATFATVGLSQLTTSRQHGRAALMVREEGDRFVFNGSMPWVTGAACADLLVTGAALEDGRLLLAVIPRETPGLRVGAPLDLMALQGSLTTEVVCEEVAIERRWLLQEPTDKLAAPSRIGAGGLETSCLALGLTGAATRFLHQEAETRPELQPIAERLEATRQSLVSDMHRLADGEGTPEQATALRGHANTLVLQATQTALTAGKGTGFLRNHPAQRWARQALFFLVWSCPRPATEATLAWLTPAGDHDHVCL